MDVEVGFSRRGRHRKKERKEEKKAKRGKIWKKEKAEKFFDVEERFRFDLWEWDHTRSLVTWGTNVDWFTKIPIIVFVLLGLVLLATYFYGTFSNPYQNIKIKSWIPMIFLCLFHMEEWKYVWNPYKIRNSIHDFRRVGLLGMRWYFNS